MKLCLVENKGEKAWTFDVKGEAISIGRSSENHIQAHDRYVSSRHLLLWKREDRFFLKNLGNRNGTAVNALQIPPGATVEIRRGDTIEIGMSILCIGEGRSGDMFAFLESLDYYNQDANDTSTAVMEDTVYNFL